jgi:hypothetical protein
MAPSFRVAPTFAPDWINPPMIHAPAVRAPLGYHWTRYQGMTLCVLGRKLANGNIEWQPDHPVNQAELVAARGR